MDMTETSIVQDVEENNLNEACVCMRGLHLLSGGIDSPVALYYLLKKADMDAVYFDNGKYGGNAEKVFRIMEVICKITSKRMRLYIVQHEKNHDEFMKCTKRYHCILCKRMMMRISSEICKNYDIDFISTGDSLGQVASQTLQNIASIENASSYPVIRPLIAMDKIEIEKIATKIGTYYISIKDAMRCKAAPPLPKIKSSVKEIKMEEKKIDVEKMCMSSFTTMTIKTY